MQQIIIVEDDRELNKGLCHALAADDRIIFSCNNLVEAREQLSICDASLVILDIGLPDGSGLSFLQEIKESASDLPVILLTANDTDMDIVEGLECGADDYITKPFSLKVLRARVNTQLKRTKSQAKRNPFVFERYIFDFDHLKFQADGAEVELSKTEQRLLRTLVENPGITLKRELLIDRIWSCEADCVDENALSVTMKRLRDKLGAADRIKTVYGVGYVWVGQDSEKTNNR